MLTKIGIILLLLFLNGFFAMAEFAIVSAKRVRLRQLVDDQKSEGAQRALDLAKDPSAFLSIVQIGVTLISVLIGAFSGATFAGPLGAYLSRFDFIAPVAEPLALFLTVAGVTYLSLVIGELVPKRIGLSYAELIAVRVSGFMIIIARIAAPAVWVLRLSTDLILRLIRLDRKKDGAVTEEEIKDMIAEGTETGVLEPAEKEMMEGVLRLADRSVRTIMTPRIDMVWLAIEDVVEENTRIILDSGFSRFPVAKGDMDAVLGIVHAKDMLAAAIRGQEVDILANMRPPLIIPDTTPVLRLLDQFKKSSQRMAIVIDEYGSVEGMVSVADILEAIVGDMPELGRGEEDEAVRRADGSWLIDGMMPVDEVEMLLGFKNMRDGDDFHTLAGFVIDRLGRLPATGDVFVWDGARFEVVDMDGRRIDKVLIYLPDGNEPA